MFAGFWLLLLFIIAIPFSFGVGGVIGFFACRVSKLEHKKAVIPIILLSGVIFICAQPASGFLLAYSTISQVLLSPFSLSVAARFYAEFALLLLIALSFTFLFSFFIAQVVRRLRKMWILKKIKRNTKNQKI